MLTRIMLIWMQAIGGERGKGGRGGGGGGSGKLRECSSGFLIILPCSEDLLWKGLLWGRAMDEVLLLCFMGCLVTPNSEAIEWEFLRSS